MFNPSYSFSPGIRNYMVRRAVLWLGGFWDPVLGVLKKAFEMTWLRVVFCAVGWLFRKTALDTGRMRRHNKSRTIILQRLSV